MKLVCAWCSKLLRDGPPERVSHGICDDCERRVSGGSDEAEEKTSAP